MSKKIDEAFKILKEMNLLNYGVVISQSDLEEVLEINMNVANTDPEYWMHQGPFLALKEKIERNGFFTTQRGHDKNLYILPINKMADHVENIYAKLKRIQRKASHSMQEADCSGLNQECRQKHLHEINRLNNLRQVTTSALSKQKRRKLYGKQVQSIEKSA